MTIITSAISIRISRLLCSFCLRAFSRAAALRALPDLEEDLPEPVFFLVVPDEFRALVPLLPFLLFELVDADPLFLAEVPFLVVCVIYFLCVLPYCSFVNPTYTYQSAGYGTHYSGSNIKIIVIRNLNIKMILSVRHLPFICQIKRPASGSDRSAFPSTGSNLLLSSNIGLHPFRNRTYTKFTYPNIDIAASRIEKPQSCCAKIFILRNMQPQEHAAFISRCFIEAEGSPD